MKIFYKIAWIGLVLSAILHVLALLKVNAFLDTVEEFSFILHGVAVLLGFPLVLCTQFSSEEITESNFWAQSMANCPCWMKKMIVSLVLYEIFNFVYCFATSAIESPDDVTGLFRFFSGGWLVIYSIEVGIFYSFLHSERYIRFQNSDEKKRIANALLKGGTVILLFILFAIACFVTGHSLLFIFVFISVWFMGIAAFLMAASAGIVYTIYYMKNYPGLLSKTFSWTYKQRIEYTNQIKRIDDSSLEKIKVMYKKIALTLFYLWVFVIVPVICVLYFVYVPKEVANP